VDDRIGASDDAVLNAPGRDDPDQSQGDLRIAQQFRKRLAESDALSTNAKNAKIIARGNVVTLRGEVQSTAEKAALAGVAQTLEGVTRVDNQLEVIGEAAEGTTP
jgi:osmotically-inducible protein OsmY